MSLETRAAGAAQAWVPRGYATSASSSSSSVVTAEQGGASDKLSRLIKGAAEFSVDNNTFAEAQIRATFYPKFENEKSDQETRTRMIEIVSQGLATIEVTLKHSGSLFMYAGHRGGAYAKNSFGNIFTAVGVFVLGRLFREAWGSKAPKMQSEFNDFLEKNRICISMELVTAVLGDHGQRPKDDYAVVTAVTELGHGKPQFYSTPELISFCRKWRLPTNHIWLFSTRKSATSFFAAYDALCEEGTATPVCKALDEIADISVPGSKDHVMVQGEILEGLVARIVNRESSVQMEEVLRNLPKPSLDGGDSDLGPSLREICAANRSDEKQQIKALIENVGSSMCPDHCDWFGNSGLEAQSRNADKSVVTHFLQAHPTDYATKKLQEMIGLMKRKNFHASFKCSWNYQKVDSLSNDNLCYKMVIHVYSDSVFRRYQQEMRKNQELWPLYRGFFVDVNLFKANNKKAAELAKDSNTLLKNINGALDSSLSSKDGLAVEDSNLMVKLKFLTYKIRTFLIRNGLSTLFKDGPSAYRTYYLRQMKIWGTSASKQKELTKMLDEWAVYIRRKYENKQLLSSTYLSEAEPFLEQYAKRSPANQALIGAAGDLVQTENFLAILDAQRDEEGDLQPERGTAPSSPTSTSLDVVSKTEGLIVFFPGIPGCAKSALCEQILSTPGGLGDNRPLHSLMGDRTKGRYWQKVADERKKKPFRITLADKNAPNEEVWRQIEDMCGTTKAAAVPVIPDSEGTDSNPFSLEALAVFMFRVLQRVNHPGNLDKASPNAGYILLMFYNLYDGKCRREFESELYERFGSLVKMPLLKPERAPLPGATTDRALDRTNKRTVPCLRLRASERANRGGQRNRRIDPPPPRRSPPLPVDFARTRPKAPAMGCSSSAPARSTGGLNNINGSSSATDSNDLRAKLVLLGDSGVGKSCIVLRFVRGQFDPTSKVTVGASFLSQTLALEDSTIVKFEIWDTAGQERYAALAPLYYRGAAAAVVVYDITSPESFKKAQYWVKELQKHGNPGIVMVLVGNKADLHESRSVPSQEAQEYAEKNSMLFMETSAKTSDNINQVFEEIAKRLPKPTTS